MKSFTCKILISVSLTFLHYPCTLSARQPVNYKLIIEAVRNILRDPRVKIPRKIIEESAKNAAFLTNLHYKILTNDPIVRSESKLSKYIKGYYEKLGPYVSLEERFKAILERYKQIDLKPVQDIEFEDIQILQYSGLEPHILNQEINSRIIQLDQLKTIADHLSEIHDELLESKKGLLSAKELLRNISKTLENEIQTNGTLGWLNIFLGKYLFDQWYDFEISYPKLLEPCLQELDEKAKAITYLITQKLKPCYLKYGGQLINLISFQETAITWRKERYEKKKKELEQKKALLNKLEQEINSLQLEIDNSQNLVTTKENQILNNQNTSNQLQNQIDELARRLQVLNDPDYDIKYFNTCPNRNNWNRCDHDEIKATWNRDKETEKRQKNNAQRDLASSKSRLLNANQTLQNEINNLVELIRGKSSTLDEKKEKYKIEKEVYEKELSIFSKSLYNEFLLAFIENVDYFKRVVNEFISYSNTL